MKNKQKIKNPSKEKGINNQKPQSSKPITGNFFEKPLYNKSKRKAEEISSINNQMETCKKTSISYYSTLLQNLNKAHEERKKYSAELINSNILPYEIPTMYSLEAETKTLCIMRKRLDIISKSILRSDVESMSFDWEQIGGDINHAIFRFQRRYTERNGG